MIQKLRKVTIEIVNELNAAYKNLQSATTNDEKEAITNRIFQIDREYNWYDIPFEKNGRLGIKDAIGKVIVPAKFDDYIETYTSDSRPEAMPMVLNGKAVLVRTDGSGDVMPGTECEDITAVAFSPFFAMHKGGKIALFNANGKMILDYICKECPEFGGGLATYEVDGKVGVVYTTGVVLPARFDEIDSSEPYSFLSVRIRDVWGYVDKRGFFTGNKKEAFWGSPR